MDIEIGFINKALKQALASSKPNTRYIIELLDRLALIDSNYDVLALRGHKPPDGNFDSEEEAVVAPPKQETSRAVDQMLKKISEEKRDGADAASST